MKKIVSLLLVLFVFAACKDAVVSKETADTTTKEVIDPLPSWNDTVTKDAIIAYVTDVTTTGSENFIPIVDRISTFDNDGNLWPYVIMIGK